MSSLKIRVHLPGEHKSKIEGLMTAAPACAKTFTLLLCLLVLSAATASAQGYADLHEFTGNGCCPQHPAILAQGRDGNVYGITPTGGTNSKGVIFKISPAGGYTVLYNFDVTHGSTPIGGLTLGNDGNLWGTTSAGGANGYGNIFKITPAGTLTVLYDFTGVADGGYPVSTLTVGRDGNYYGTSYPGVAYKLSPAGVFTVINKIPTTTFGPLLQASNGSFYGVTEFGGTFSAGTIYKITGTTVTTLYSFDGPHGSYPIGGLVEGSDRNLYGTTTAGGTTNAGVIYKITPAGALSVVVNFDGVHTLDGYQAFAGMIAGSDGNLYGATIWGGQYGYGVIFELSTGGGYAVLYNFDAPHGDGAYPTPMQHTDGKIFGMTERGGTPGKGGIYSYDAGITPFIKPLTNGGVVGQTVGILGTGFGTASGVTFNGTPASFHVISNTYMTATVPSGESGFISVTTSSGTLISNRVFYVTPKVLSIAPTSGPVGTSVVITGAGLIQASNITVGGVRVTTYTVNSDSQLTAKVPTGAKTGKIVVTTPGGQAASSTVFTVTP